jgi:hypothetical protein
LDRRGISVLLLPLLAAFAIFYPGMRPAREVASALQSLAESQLGAENQKSQQSGEWPRGPDMVREFLDVPLQGEPQWPEHDRRRNIKIDFLIATLPDPIESGLPHQFDRLFSSVQSALQGASNQNFVLARFDLPWLECLKKQGEGKGEEKDKSVASPQSSNCGNNPKYEQEPGVALFTEPGAAAKAVPPHRPVPDPPVQAPPTSTTPTPQPETHVLLLYVIGETPTGGIHKTAMGAALSDVAWFCGFRHGDNHPLPQWLQGKSNCADIRVMGPTFSGSAQSLDFVLSSWLNSFGELPVASVNIISGSATAIRPQSDFLNLQRIFASERMKGHTDRTFSFHSMQASNRTSFSFLLRYVQQIQPCGSLRRVALLSEGNTVYGQTTPKRRPDKEILADGRNLDSHPCNTPTEVTRIPFPLHISQLRAALQRVRSSQRETAPQPASNSEGLPLDQSLEEVNQRHDSVPPLSQLDTATAELVMSNLLSTISQEKYHYVGILATDVRDVIFLAREIREHCPETIIFAFNPDLLFLHPEENASLRGMLLVGSYPLFSFNQLWSPPYYAADMPGDQSPRARFQFPDQGSQGIYEATLAFLGPESEKQMLEFGLPFEDVSQNPKPTADGRIRPPLWITVVGRDRMWPVQVYDLNSFSNARWYLYGADVKSAGDPKEEKRLWWRGLYPSGALVLSALVSVFSMTFCGLVLRQSRRSKGQLRIPRVAGPVLESSSEENSLRSRADEVPLRPQREPSYLLAACASLTAFLTVALSALLVPSIVMAHVGAFHLPGWANEWGWAVAVIALGCVALLMLLYTSWVLLTGLTRQAKQPWTVKGDDGDRSSWSHIAAGAAVLFSLCLYLGLWSILQALPNGEFRTALFSSMRSLHLLSGVSPLLPVFLISMAGFIWAIGCYFRVRALEALESKSGFLPLGFELAEISTLEKELRGLLQRSTLFLPKSYIVVTLVLTSGVYLWLAFVRSVEAPPLYLLLFVSFVLLNLVLWLGVLRFFCVWRQMRHLLRQLSWSPLGAACNRFRKSLPNLPKIDLASPAPTLARLMYSVDYAQALCQRAGSLVFPRKQGLRLAAAVGAEGLASASLSEVDTGIAAGPVLSAPEIPALKRLCTSEFASRVAEAETFWKAARDADARGDLAQRTANKRASQEALSDVAAEVSAVLQDSWWDRIHDVSPKQSVETGSTPDDVFRLGEDFLVGRVASLLAHTLPQMQNLIVTSVAGLLLLLFAVSSYPFQPHDLLLLFNWTGILTFVAIAMWVFVQMNRDPLLSSLNGTKPGQINWNKEFIIRIVVYGIVPILALLGAQFPQSVGQVVSHFIPSEATHH